MSALDDLTAAVAAEDDAVGKAIAYIQSVAGLLQQAFDAGKASNDAALAALQADVQVHTDAIVAALPVTPDA